MSKNMDVSKRKQSIIAGGLIISQMVLSIQLPFTVFLQVGLTSSRKAMGDYVNSKWSTFVLYTIAVIVTVLNIMLLFS